MRAWIASILLAAVCSFTPAIAQEKASFSDNQLAAAQEVLKITGAENIMRGAMQNQAALIEQQIKRAAPETDAATIALLQTIVREETEKGIPRIMDESAKIYARHFSEADIRGLIAFYKTPLGEKMITQLPAVAKESAQMGAELSGTILVRFREELAKRKPPEKAQ